MDIIFEKPIRFTMDVQEIDERSFGMNVHVTLSWWGLSQQIDYTGDTWIECDRFREFTHAICTGQSATLSDMDGLFRLGLEYTPSGNTLRVQIVGQKNAVSQTFMQYDSVLDNDDGTRIVDAFRNFPHWWD